MEIKTFTRPRYVGAEIVKDSTQIVYAYITADCYIENTAFENALQLIYKDILLSGAGSYSREEFLHALNELGASINVIANEGKIMIEISVLEPQLAKVLRLFELMLTTPAFKASELKRAVFTAKNRLELYKEEAKALAWDGLKSALYKGSDRHYTHSADTISNELKKITISDIKKLHQKFVDSYFMITVSGNVKTTAAVFKLIDKIKKDRPVPSQIEVSTAKEEIIRPQIISQSVPSKQNVEISIGASIPLTIPQVELAHFLFGLTVLGKWGGFAGRLMSTVREKEGLTYGIYARLEGATRNETGYWRIMTFFSPQDTMKGIKSTLREISKIREKGITKSEWERFQTILKTSGVLTFDSLSGLTSLVHSNLVAGLSFEEYEDFRNILYTCTQSEVNKALKKYLDLDKLVISAAGPVASIDKDLKTFTLGESELNS